MDHPKGKREESPPLNLESLKLDASLVGAPKPPPKKKPIYKRRFLKGPVPMAWLAEAHRVASGSGTLVGNILWHLSGLKHNERTILLSNVECAKWGVSRQAKALALDKFEDAGLVTLQRRSKASPLVTIVVDAADEQEAQ
jgi:hypothetical protein